MRWKGARQSDNFKDSRGKSTGGKIALGGIGGVIVLLIGLFIGGDPSELMNQLQSGGFGSGEATTLEISAEEAELTEFCRVVLASTEDVWSELYARSGQKYS